MCLVEEYPIGRRIRQGYGGLLGQPGDKDAVHNIVKGPYEQRHVVMHSGRPGIQRILELCDLLLHGLPLILYHL